MSDPEILILIIGLQISIVGVAFADLLVIAGAGLTLVVVGKRIWA